MIEPKVFEIDSVQGGYHNSEKLQAIYRDLRREVLPQEPFQRTFPNTITIQKSWGWRGGQYGFEMYKFEEISAIVALEYFGSWNGYAPGSSKAPQITEAMLHRINLTVHDSNADLEEKIGEIIARYPREKEVVVATNLVQG